MQHARDVLEREVPVQRRTRGQRVPRDRRDDEVVGKSGRRVLALHAGEEREEFEEGA